MKSIVNSPSDPSYPLPSCTCPSGDRNPSPEFSIRDYVYGLRSKDVQQHWPFSDESLMLCLKHGVRNLLPPFQPLDSPKNPFVIEKTLPDNEIVTSSNVEPSKQSEIKTPSQPSQVKKCKLGIKLSPIVDPTRTNEDITTNNFMVSETMASNVCPVCKTFTSSSNTTLNAHIDQCLSVEPKSTMKRTTNPKVINNRVKPRKTRLMVDVYKTALPCTVEELDRRNGTNWSTNSSFPTQEIEFHGEELEKEERVSDENVVEPGHKGDVYIDSDGMKNRILSAPEIGAEDDHGSRKLMKRKGDKFIVDKNEKQTREQKKRKLLRLCKKFSSPTPPRAFEMGGNQGENFSVEEDTTERRFESDEELELDDDQGPKEKMSFSRTLSSSETPISSPVSSKKMDTSSYEPQNDEYVNHLPLRKRLGFRSGFSALKETRPQVLSVEPRNTIADAESSGKETKTHGEGPTIEPNSTGVYQGPFSEPEKLTLEPQPIMDDREKMFCEEDNDKTMTDKTNCKIGEFNYFLEVEPIPIPGPPGSFLPSPGADMVSEDVQGNSSLTNNSRVQSSEDRLDLVDRDPMTLDSPISATSTVSNPTLTRFDSRSSEKLSVQATFPKKRVSPSLRNDHQPCDFSRKEGVAQSFSSRCQESDLLRSRAIDRPVNSLTLNPETFTPSNYPPEKAFVPPEHVPVTAPTATAAATPVLRLMGKDLMVAKKDDVSPAPQLTPPQSSSFDHPNQHFFTAPLPTAPRIYQNRDCYYQSLQVFPPYGHGGSIPFVMPQTHFPSGYDPRHVNSFYKNQSFAYGGPQVAHDASFPMEVSREMINASPAVWNHAPEGSSLVGVSRKMNTSPAMWKHNVPESSVVGVSSPARAHWRSTAYFPTSFS